MVFSVQQKEPMTDKNNSLNSFYTGVISNSPVGTPDSYVLWNNILYFTSEESTTAINTGNVFLFYDISIGKLYIVVQESNCKPKLYITNNVLFDMLNNNWVKFKIAKECSEYSTIDEVVCECGGSGPVDDIRCWTNISEGVDNTFFGQTNNVEGNDMVIQASYSHAQVHDNHIVGNLYNGPFSIRVGFEPDTITVSILDPTALKSVIGHGYVLFQTEERYYTGRIITITVSPIDQTFDVIVAPILNCNELPLRNITALMFCSNFGMQANGFYNISSSAKSMVMTGSRRRLEFNNTGFNNVNGVGNSVVGNYVQINGMNTTNEISFESNVFGSIVSVSNLIMIGDYNFYYINIGNGQSGNTTLTSTEVQPSVFQTNTTLPDGNYYFQLLDAIVFEWVEDLGNYKTSISFISETVILCDSDLNYYAYVSIGGTYQLMSYESYIIKTFAPQNYITGVNLLLRVYNDRTDITGFSNLHNGTLHEIKGDSNRVSGNHVTVHGDGNNISGGSYNYIFGSNIKTFGNRYHMSIGTGGVSRIIPPYSLRLVKSGSIRSEISLTTIITSFSTPRRSTIISLYGPISFLDGIPYLNSPASPDASQLIKLISGVPQLDRGFVDIINSPISINYISFNGSPEADQQNMAILSNHSYKVRVDFCGKVNDILYKKGEVPTYEIVFETDFVGSIILDSLVNNQCIFYSNRINPATNQLVSTLPADPLLYIVVDQPQRGYVKFGYVLLSSEVSSDIRAIGIVTLDVLLQSNF